jgi:diguanylate cyclase (GGDEF)-like protein
MNTSIRTPNFSGFHKFAWAFAAIMLVKVAALLMWIQQSRFEEYMAYQQRIMQGSVSGTAEEVGLFMSELRRSVHLFADSKKDLLRELAAHPEDDTLHDQLGKTLHSHFPDAFAFTIADLNGTALLADFDGLVGEVCIRDIRKFAADRRHSEVYIHPHPAVYHFDVMVDWEQDSKSVGIFFISFPTEVLSKILKHGQAPDHKLMLLHRDIPGLIEVTDEGARIKLQRDFKLNQKEMQTIGYSMPIPGTAWNLVDIPAPGLFQGVHAKLQRGALLVMLAFIVVSAIMLGLLYRTHTRNQRLNYLYTHDPLTGLPNRYLLIDCLQQLIAEAQRKNFEFALMFIDPGEFRGENTTFFDRPDTQALLKSAGNRIKSFLTPSDTLARLAGNEFAVLLTKSSEEQATRVGESLCEALSYPLLEGTDVIAQQVSVGIAVYPAHGADFETLIQHANIALHRVKRNNSPEF